MFWRNKHPVPHRLYSASELFTDWRRAQRLLWKFWDLKADLSLLLFISLTLAAICVPQCWFTVVTDCQLQLKSKCTLPDKKRERKRENQGLWRVLNSVRVDLIFKHSETHHWCVLLLANVSSMSMEDYYG